MSFFNKVWSAVKAFFVKDAAPFLIKNVEPVAEAWLKQFTTAFGAIAVVEAKEFADQVKTGQKTMKDAGHELSSDLVKRGKVTAEEVCIDVALNAIRMYLTPSK